MLVIARSLVLTVAEAALPANAPAILWDNRVTTANVSSDTAAADYPAVNLANPATTQEWRAADTTEQYVTAAIDTVDEVAAVGLARHNLGSAGIAVSVEGDDGGGFAELVEPFIPANDEPLMLVFTAQSLASVRVKLAAGAAAARIAVMACGPLLRLPRGYDVDRDFVAPRFGRRTEAVIGRSERGDYLGRIITSRHVETELLFSHFDAAWYRAQFDPFVAAAQQDTSFFLAWAPQDYPEEVAYCWLTDDPMPQVSPVTGRQRVSLKLAGIVE